MRSLKTQLAVIDTETTGLSPAKHEVIEVGILRIEQWFENDNIYARRLHELCVKMHPRNIAVADPIALKINGYTALRWQDAKDHEPALFSVRDALTFIVPGEMNQNMNDLVLVGHNIHFDVSFMIEMFRRENIDFEMNKRAIDIYSVALRVIGRQNQKSFSLGALCERFDIEYKNRHTAMGDVNATYEVYKKLFDITEVNP